VSPVRYELGVYIPEDAILHSHCRENLKSYTCFVLNRSNFREKCLFQHSRNFPSAVDAVIELFELWAI
jgi:hypothetical protein